MNQKEKKEYLKGREESMTTFKNYEIGAYAGMTSGFIVVVVTTIVTNMINKGINLLLSLIFGITFAYLLFYTFITRSMQRQREGWGKLDKKIKLGKNEKNSRRNA